MYTKSTENYQFPQWEWNDHPDFLNDMNPAYKTIDEALAAVKEVSDANAENISVLTPIVTEDNKTLEETVHTVSDNVTKITNLEHTTIDLVQRVEPLEAHRTCVDNILVGYNESSTVYSDVRAVEAKEDATQKSLEEQIAHMEKVQNMLLARKVYSGITFTDNAGVSIPVNFLRYGRDIVASFPSTNPTITLKASAAYGRSTYVLTGAAAAIIADVGEFFTSTREYARLRNTNATDLGREFDVSIYKNADNEIQITIGASTEITAGTQIVLQSGSVRFTASFSEID